jgi:hypothetical protein
MAGGLDPVFWRAWWRSRVTSYAMPLRDLGRSETVIIAGQASQTSTLRWEDFATTVVDPSDDLTFYYVGNYLKTGSTTPATRIASVRVP